MFRYVSYLAVLIFSLSLVFYGNALAEDNVLAKIGDREITISDLNRIIGYLDTKKQQMIEQNSQYKLQLLEQFVQSIVLSDMAKKAGYEEKKDIKEKLEFFTDNFLGTEYVRREVVDTITISGDEIKSYYDEHKDDFKTPEMVQVRHILIRVSEDASDDEKKEARKKIDDILNKIKSGEDFAKLASEFSEDTVTKSKGGDLGFVPRGKLVKSFEDVAFSLKPGEVSEIVETSFGYHIIKVDDKKDASFKPFDAVKGEIEQKLYQEKVKNTVTEFIEKAMKDAGVEFHTELITGIKKEEE